MAFGELERDGFDAASGRPMSDINVTPLVDVMLVLLVIFIITAPLMVSGIKLELPQAQALAPASAPESLSVTLDAGMRLYVDEQPVSPEALKARLQAVAAQGPDTEVLLRADASVPYGQVLALIGDIQQSGLSRIAFVAEAPDVGR